MIHVSTSFRSNERANSQMPSPLRASAICLSRYREYNIPTPIRVGNTNARGHHARPGNARSARARVNAKASCNPPASPSLSGTAGSASFILRDGVRIGTVYGGQSEKSQPRHVHLKTKAITEVTGSYDNTILTSRRCGIRDKHCVVVTSCRIALGPASSAGHEGVLKILKQSSTSTAVDQRHADRRHCNTGDLDQIQLLAEQEISEHRRDGGHQIEQACHFGDVAVADDQHKQPYGANR